MRLQLIGLLLAVSAALIGPASAVAGDAPISCPPGQSADPVSGLCIIVVGGGGGGGDEGDRGGPGGSGDVVTVAVQKCVWNTVRIYTTEVPCTSSLGYFSNHYQCYISPLSPQPPFSDPRWEGHSEGAIYHCYPPLPYIDGPAFAAYDLWSATPPAGPAAPPDPRALARRAVATMRLRAITMGLVPEPRPGYVGLVGMPNWMWVEAPTEGVSDFRCFWPC